MGVSLENMVSVLQSWKAFKKGRMNVPDLTYRIQTATVSDVERHLLLCKDNFIPALDTSVDIQHYANKIVKNSITFEAWDKQVLAGLIAAYFNDPQNQTGYITNVSTLGGYARRGIASRLLEQCIGYARKKKFGEIRLEVHRDNPQAKQLYAKYEFRPTGDTEQLTQMTLHL